jgi:hypothetical protein
MSMIELRKASELEQEVCELTGNPRKSLIRHPDGLKQDGDDGREDIFGKAYTKVRKTVPNSGKLNYIRTEPLPPAPIDAAEVEVYFAFRGNYSRVTVSSDVSQEDVERMGCNHFQSNVCLTDFHAPTPGTNDRFKAMYCRDRDNASWIVCKRSDTADEEWVLFGQELTDEEIVRVMEDRWYTPLKKIKTKRPLENNSLIMFGRRPVDDEVDEDEVSGVAPVEPLHCFTTLTGINPPPAR